MFVSSHISGSNFLRREGEGGRREKGGLNAARNDSDDGWMDGWMGWLGISIIVEDVTLSTVHKYIHDMLPFISSLRSSNADNTVSLSAGFVLDPWTIQP